MDHRSERAHVAKFCGRLWWICSVLRAANCNFLDLSYHPILYFLASLFNR